MKRFTIRVKRNIKVTRGPRDTWIIYKDGVPIGMPLPALATSILVHVLEVGAARSDELASNFKLSPQELNQELNQLRTADFIEQTVNEVTIANDNIVPSHVGDTPNGDFSLNHSSFIQLKRIDKYTFRLADLSNTDLFTSKGLVRAVQLFHEKFAFLAVILAAFMLFDFYHSPVRALGAQIRSELFLDTSIFEIFPIVLLTQLLTCLYKILIGIGANYSSSILYLKFMAGFHPVFEAEEDKPFNQNLKVGKWDYLRFVASPQVMRSYIIIASILLIRIYYPFAFSGQQFLLKMLLITINISMITFFWYIFPSPGSVTFKAFEIFNIMPPRLVGISIKRLFREDTWRKPGVNRRYKIFLLLIVSLLVVKVSYLLFVLLPEFIGVVPEIFGSWTPQIVYCLLIIMAVRFIMYRYSSTPQPVFGGPAAPSIAKSASQPKLVKSTTISPLSKSTELLKKDTSWFSNQNFSIGSLLISKRKLLAVLLVLSIFPYMGSVTGSANIEESMSLSIKYDKEEPAIITDVHKLGPSSKVVAKGDLILQLSSPTLETLISQSKEAIVSLENSASIYKTELKSLREGSKFLDAKKVNESIEQNYADIASAKYELQSLESQIAIVKDELSQYAKLRDSGAVSVLQYNDKWKELSDLQIKFKDSNAALIKLRSELTRNERDKVIDQDLRIPEEIETSLDKLRSTQAELSKERSELNDLQRRMETLDVYAPFDCVIDSDTSVLNGKSVAYQDVLLSIRSVPSALVIVSVPENERAYLSVGDSTEIRLYSKIEKVLYGRVQKISPVTTESNDQDIVQVYIKLADDLPANFIGAVGVAKIRTGWTCLLWTSLKPIARFIHVDIWSYLP